MDAAAKELLDQADACHDDDPARAAELLRRIDAETLDAGHRPLLAFLLNHVLGEKLGLWHEAQSLTAVLAALAGAAAPVLRHAAVAARLAGDESAATTLAGALAKVTGTGAAHAGEMVQLAADVMRVAALPAAPAAALTMSALAALKAAHWQMASPLDTPAAAQCNNLASGLLDRPLPDLALPELRTALEQAAICSQQLWQRAGNWVNHERAWYLRALAASAQGDAGQALAHARAGLALLDAHDSAHQEDVDRAFLALEESFALQRLGRAEEAAASRSRADQLAAAFDDASLTPWFAQRVARNAALLTFISSG